MSKNNRNSLLNILLTLLVVYSFYGQQSNTSLDFNDFKTGVFEAVNENKIYIIKREKKYQFEKIKGIEGEIKYKIEWINSQEYVLIYTSNTLSDKKLSQKYSSIKDSIFIKLNEIKGDYCYFETTFRGKVLYDRIRKID